VSLDSLAADRFFQLTRATRLHRVMAGLEAAQAHPELRPIKVNAVALRGFTEDEVLRFAEFAREQPYEVRFIEFMPLDADQAWDMDKVLPNAEVPGDHRVGVRDGPARPRAPRHRTAATRSPTGAARSASSPPSPSRSAATATGSA
jgi:molybdenum cofactor biosynthesis enzyme MoaA